MISSPLLMLCECSWVYSGKSHKSRAIQSNAMCLVSNAEPWNQTSCSTSGEQRTWDWDLIQPRAWLQSCPAIQHVIEDQAVPCTLFLNNQLVSLCAPYSKYSFKATLTFHCTLFLCWYCMWVFYEVFYEKQVFSTLFYSRKTQALWNTVIYEGRTWVSSILCKVVSPYSYFGKFKTY